MGNENAANLIDRILADAKEAAAKVLADAEASASGIRKSRDEEIAKKAEQVEKEREQQISVILNGCRTRAELDGRKDTLRAKRALLDGVFAETYARMLALATGSPVPFGPRKGSEGERYRDAGESGSRGDRACGEETAVPRQGIRSGCRGGGGLCSVRRRV